MAQIPPWLNINPSDYLQAAQAGAALGMQIAQAQNRANEMAMAQAAEEAQAMRVAEARRWEFEQNLRQRATELAAQREQAAARLAESQRYHLAALENQQAGNLARAANYERMAKMAEASATGKEYGEILIKDLGGGVRAAYRERSPGLHLIQPKNLGEVSPTKAADLLKQWDILSAETPELADTKPELINRLRRGLGKGPFVPPNLTTVTNPPPPVNLEQIIWPQLRKPTVTSITNAPAQSVLGPPPAIPEPTSPAGGTEGSKLLTRDKVREFYQRAGGDRMKAEQLARDEGYSL